MDELVNIPALLIVSDGGTRFPIWSVYWFARCLAQGMNQANPIQYAKSLAEDEASVESILAEG